MRQNTLDALFARAQGCAATATTTKPTSTASERSREDDPSRDVENVDPATAMEEANAVVERWSRVAGAVVERAETSSDGTGRACRAAAVKRAAYAYVVKMKNAARSGGMIAREDGVAFQRRALALDLRARELGRGSSRAKKRLRMVVGGGAAARAAHEYGVCALPRVMTTRISASNNAVSAIEFDSTGSVVTSATNGGAIDAQAMSTLRVTGGELYCPTLKLSTEREIEAIRWNHDGSLVMTTASTSRIVMAYKGESVRAPGSRGMSHRTLRMQEYRVQETDSNCCSGLRDLLLDTKDPRCIFASSSQGQGYMWDTRLSGEKETAQLFSPLKIASAVSSPLVISDDGHTVIGGDGERGELLIWDMRKLGGKSMSFGTLGDKAQRFGVIAQLSVSKLLQKTVIAEDIKISDVGIHWLGYDPADQRRLGFHLSNGWSGVIDVMKPCVTHAHCPPAPWLEVRAPETGAINELQPDHLSVPMCDLRRRTACWLPDGGSLAVGLGVKPGVRVLDFAPTSTSRHWLQGFTVADIDREPESRYASGHEPILVDTTSKIFTVAAHPHNHGELVAGGESCLSLIASRGNTEDARDDVGDASRLEDHTQTRTLE